jgi:hypothetical protein
VDFRLKKRKAGHVGLHIGLASGSYQGVKSINEATYITEEAFWFLEPSIKERCARYSNYSHWGHTAISREEWLGILDDWDALSRDLDVAILTTDLGILRRILVTQDENSSAIWLGIDRNCPS